MKILGIGLSHCCGITFIENGKVVFAQEEDRFTRKRRQKGWPQQTLNFFFNNFGLKEEDIDLCVISDIQSAKIINKKINAKKTILLHHHLAHVMSGWAFSDSENCNYFTLDGGGDFNSWQSFAKLRDNKFISWESNCGYYLDNIKQKKKFFNFFKTGETFGSYWSKPSVLNFGMLDSNGIGGYEGKLMGLAAHGNKEKFNARAFNYNANFSLKKKKEYFFMKTEGNQKLGLDDYVIGLDKKKYSLKEVRDLRKNKVIISEYDLNKNKNLNIAANFASFLQHNTNKIIERLINKNFDNDIPLVVSGGTFANVLVNGILNKQFDFFVCPPMGDEGLSLGAAAWGAYINGFTHLDLNTLYLGYNAGTNFNKANPNQIAKLLKKSKIIGLIEGNMEFGPRALGARSILAEPSDYGKNYSINKRLNRVEYMPFAPVILKEFANEILEGWSEKHKSSKHMTLTYKVHPKWVKKLKGVVHKDGTVRPQVIDKTDNKFYYSIVYAFFKLTGIPVLINTSFNRHGEPMVRTHKEAIDVLKNKKIDHLISNGKIY